MPALIDYSLADINKYSLLGDFPIDFKNACDSESFGLSLEYNNASEQGIPASIEYYNISERILTAHYKFQLSALLVNRSIEMSAPGKFGLYGYLEEMAVAFSNNEKMDELSNVYLFTGCISNALGYMKNSLPAYAKAHNLDDAVTEVIASKIADAAKYYDNASKVFAEFVAKLPKKEPKEEKVSDAEQSLKMLSSLSLYETSRFVCNKDYDYVDSILSQINLNSLKDDKDAVFTFEKLIILSNINYGERFASALCKCLKENNAFDSNGNVIKYVGMTGYKYDELKNASLRTFKDPSQIKDYIIETDDLISSISYMLSTFNYINEHYVFLANYRGMEEKLGNPHDSYIRMLIKYYSKLYADFINVYNRLLTQYLSDMKQDANGVYNKYKAIVSRESATAKSKCFERESAKKTVAKTKTTASTVSKPKPAAPKKFTADDEKKLRDLSPSQAYKMADDASVTDKQRNEYVDNLTTYATNTSYIATSVDLCEKAILISRKSRYKLDNSIKILANKLKSADAVSSDNKVRGSFAGTLGSSLASCINGSHKSEYVGSHSRYTTSALSIALCAIFIGFIWIVNHESVQWLGTQNMTKLLILAGLGIICGIFTGGAKKIIANLVVTGIVFTVGAIVTDVLDFSQIAQDRTILTVSALVFAYLAFISMAENTRGSVEGAKRKNTENAAKLKDNIAGNIQYANAMIESLEPVRTSNSDASVLIEYYKAIKKAFENIKI